MPPPKPSEEDLLALTSHGRRPSFWRLATTLGGGVWVISFGPLAQVFEGLGDRRVHGFERLHRDVRR